MHSYILDKLEIYQQRWNEIQVLLDDYQITSDFQRFQKLSQEYSKLSDIIYHYQCWKKIKNNIQITNNLLQDPELYQLAQEELQNFYFSLQKLENKIYTLLLPQNIDDTRNCFLEIRAGTGGNEASLFAGDLFRMYSYFVEHRKWKMKVINAHSGERGGFKDIVIKISHSGAYGFLKFESGGHRVQRIPNTESQGRIHTSTCTVAVTPELLESELPEINMNDIRIDTFRSSGAGGQHVNTTDSAIRITHIPTGIIVECQDERSQHKNKSKALSVLKTRIRSIEIHKKHQEECSIRRNLLGSGDRSDRIRTYNFPQRRVTDHRINLTLYRLEEIMEGKLDILIRPIIKEYQIDQLMILSKKE